MNCPRVSKLNAGTHQIGRWVRWFHNQNNLTRLASPTDAIAERRIGTSSLGLAGLHLRAHIIWICAANTGSSKNGETMHNGGSARDYLLGFAWSGATVMVQRASGRPYGYSSAPSG